MSMFQLLNVDWWPLQIERILETSGTETNVAMLENILSHVGNMYKALGQSGKAVPAFESSLQIQENTLGNLCTLQLRLDVFNLDQAWIFDRF